MNKPWIAGSWKRLPFAIGLGLLGLAFASGMALLFGFVVLWLWNWLMPEIFGLPAISYWQAWGLILLSHILVKSGRGSHIGPGRHRRGHGHGRHFDKEHLRRKMHERFRDEDNHDTDGPHMA